MIEALQLLCMVVAGVCYTGAAYRLNAAADRLLEECQMMRTARSASSHCPLVGHVHARNVL